MNELLALGISHKTAPVALRERLALAEPEASEFVKEAVASAEVREAVVISTCNRTEVSLVVGDPVRAESDVLGLLAVRASIRPTELAEAIYSPRNCDAARQLYRGTAGKRVRSETPIGASRVSIPSVAVDLALSVLGTLENRHVVILGAGDTSELTVRAL